MTRRIDERLREISWPTSAACPTRLGRDDAVVVCAGFEDRALAFLHRASQAGAQGFRIIAIEYVPRVAENRSAELAALAAETRASLETVLYNRTEPDSVAGVIDSVRGVGRLFIDVSGMSRLLIVQLVAIAIRRQLVARTTIVYTEAERYPPSEAEFIDKVAAERADYRSVLCFISSGVIGLTVVPELSTVAMQGQPVHVVAFPSFNPTQFATLCAEIGPSSLTILNGIPPKRENRWRRDAIRQLNDIASLHNCDEVDVSTCDYRETLGEILRVYGRVGATQKLIIAPTGSKMQTLAVGIAAGFMTDLQVVYPTPKVFPDPANYTRGVQETVCVDLGAFRTALGAAE